MWAGFVVWAGIVICLVQRAETRGGGGDRMMGEILRWCRWVSPARFLLICSLVTAGAVPIDTDKTKVNAEAADDGQKSQSSDTGLYYNRYLREVVEVLETDQHFREKIQSADIEDIKSGKISKELDLVSHHIRTRLDELKRQEVSRLRMLIKAKLSTPESAGIDRRLLLQQFNHLNHMNPNSFEPQDLDLLIKA
ncbi:nucleobindin-2-like, partial [Hyla sarda]|uniref:nucleobindin-2-like n=1 Tax=Hyla sarda TaxID=327740 RepID=UPI0024C301DF